MNPNDSEQQRHNPQAMRFKSWLPRLLATQAWEYFLISLNLASDFFFFFWPEYDDNSYIAWPL